jgi:hypothetical protein
MTETEPGVTSYRTRLRSRRSRRKCVLPSAVLVRGHGSPASRATARSMHWAPSGSDSRTERYAVIAPGSQTTA